MSGRGSIAMEIISWSISTEVMCPCWGSNKQPLELQPDTRSTATNTAYLTADSSRAVASFWQNYVHLVLANHLGGISLPRNSVKYQTEKLLTRQKTTQTSVHVFVSNGTMKENSKQMLSVWSCLLCLTADPGMWVLAPALLHNVWGNESWNNFSVILFLLLSDSRRVVVSYWQ